MAHGRVRMRNHRKRLVFSFLISLFLLVGLVMRAFGAGINFVPSATNAGANFVATTAAVSVNAGDTVVAIGGAQSGSVVFTDSESDTPTLVNTEVDGGATIFDQMSYFTVATTSATYTVTATFSGGTSGRNSLVVLVYRGVTSVGSNAINTGLSTSPSVVLTTATSSDYAVAGFSWRGTSGDCTTGLVGNDRALVASASSSSRVTSSGFDNTGSTSVTNTECLGASSAWVAITVDLKGSVAYTQSLPASLGSSASLSEKNSLFRSLSGSLTLASSLAQKNSLFRSLSSSLTLASSLAEKISLFRTLSGSLTLASSLVEKNSIFRTLSGSLALTTKMMFTSIQASKTTPVSCTLQPGAATMCTLNPTSSISTASGQAAKNSLLRAVIGSLGLSGSSAVKNSLFKTLTSSLTLASSFAEHTALSRSLTGSLTLASSFSNHSSWSDFSSFHLVFQSSGPRALPRLLPGSSASPTASVRIPQPF